MTEALWRSFWERRDAATRERLARSYIDLVRGQARQVAGRAAQLKPADLERCGLMGLLTAIDRFDPDLGVPFETFAQQRIRGAMADYVRTVAVGRAGDDEAAQAAPLPTALVAAAGVTGCEDAQVLEAELRRAIEALPPAHKVVVGLHYCDGVEAAEIARVLDVTERQVEDLRAEALEHLRTHLTLRAWLDRTPPAPQPVRYSPVVA